MTETNTPAVSALSSACLADAKNAPHSLTVSEGFTDPLGFHDATPSFSWKLPDGAEKQTAYRIELKGAALLWDSGWVASDQSVFVPYVGAPLQSRQRLEWRVRFRDQNGKESDWSETARFELGLLAAKDWQAQWIRPAASSTAASAETVERVGWLRRELSVNGDVERARLYVTARGVFEVHLNSQRVGNDYFANGWTSYNRRLDTLTYDVTGQLREGSNSIGALLGTGWYAGRIGWQHRQSLYGRDPELLLQLEIHYEDGRKETVASDERWEGTFDGPILFSSLYDGEHYDARRRVSGWQPVAANAEFGPARLVPKPFAPVRAIETLPAREITEPESGHLVFDLSQNMVGWAKLRIPVEKDQTVTIRFAEMLNKDGTLYTANYRSARSIDYYTPAETGTIEWEPTFTFHGFRYVELTGLPEGVKPDQGWVTGVVLHSDLARTGTFESSHPKLNQLQSNVAWGQRGNFLDIPTDCPQRDERLGWTGDAQVFCPTSMFNFDCHAFWKSWLGSMRNEQLGDGRIPHVIPDALGAGGSPGWMDAATMIPWEVYVRTGDREVLAENYDMMERLIAWYRGQSKDGLIPKIGGFGDWLQPYSETRGDTSKPLLGTAFYAHGAQILADSARVLGKTADAEKYTAEASHIREAFTSHYFDADDRLQNAPETQTAYILAIAFDLVPRERQAGVSAHLVRLIGEADGHLRTGFLGTPYITQVLDRIGQPGLAYSLLFKETYPSWFFSIDQGATTLWERWNSYSHKDGFGPVEMNSFNHYAYGAIGQWMVERIPGLAPDPANPGYRHFFVRPLVGSQLDWARAELETPYGRTVSEWHREGCGVQIAVLVPPNTTATIEFPDGRAPQTVSSGRHTFEMQTR